VICNSAIISLNYCISCKVYRVNYLKSSPCARRVCACVRISNIQLMQCSDRIAVIQIAVL